MEDKQEPYASGSVDARIEGLEKAIADLRRDLGGRSNRADGDAGRDERADDREEPAERRRMALARPAGADGRTGREAGVPGTEALRAEIEILEDRLQEQAAEAEALRKSEVREIKALAEGREQVLRRSHAARLSETRKVAGRRILRLQAQRRADVETLRRNHARGLSRARAELRERLAELEERAAGLKLRLETDAGVYAGRLEELESSRNRERLAAERENRRLWEEHAASERRLRARITELEEAVEEHEGLRRSLLEELQREKTRNEGCEARDRTRDASRAAAGSKIRALGGGSGGPPGS